MVTNQSMTNRHAILPTNYEFTNYEYLLTDNTVQKKVNHPLLLFSTHS